MRFLLEKKIFYGERNILFYLWLTVINAFWLKKWCIRFYNSTKIAKWSFIIQIKLEKIWFFFSFFNDFNIFSLCVSIFFNQIIIKIYNQKNRSKVEVFIRKEILFYSALNVLFYLWLTVINAFWLNQWSINFYNSTKIAKWSFIIQIKHEKTCFFSFFF